METTVFIKELDDYVIFTATEEWQQDGFSCDHLRKNKTTITEPEITFQDIQWDTHLYTPAENQIIEQYLNRAEEGFRVDYTLRKTK